MIAVGEYSGRLALYKYPAVCPPP